MRYVTIPETVLPMTLDGTQQMREPTNADGSETRPLTITMEKFLDMYVANDRKGTASLKSVRFGIELMKKLGKAEAGDVVCIDEGAYDLAKGIIEEPSQPFVAPHVFRQCMSFVSAIIDAPTVDPHLAKAAE